MNFENRVEELYTVLLEEYENEGPGGVVKRVADTQDRERDDILRFLDTHIISESVRIEIASVVSDIFAGKHRS